MSEYKYVLGNFRTDLLIKSKHKLRVLLLLLNPVVRFKRKLLNIKFRYLLDSVDFH